jgi:chemotaxis protein MotA
MGIIGTVMGLIKVLGSLTDPNQLGPAVALAFIATLYGVCFANLVWLPISGKLKLKTKLEIVQKELIVEGVMSIQAGENPRTLKEKLEVFLLDKG